MRILLVCERSAGHIFPALAIAKKLRDKNGLRNITSWFFSRQIKTNSGNGGAEIYFFATSTFLKSYIEKEGFRVLGKGFKSRNLIFECLWRFFEAIYLIIKLQPAKVIGFGGRDSFFLVLFSSFLPVDIAIYEPNVRMGKANKVLSFFARRIMRGFTQERESEKMLAVGVPLRENIKRIDKAAARKMLNFNNKPVIFCFGGSQGSSFLNNIFMKFIQRFSEDYQIIHLTGSKDYIEIIKLYNKIRNRRFVKDFYYEMEVLYSAADVVIARAGASTLAEISYYGLPAILIPHPKGGGHQKENAFYFQKKGAAFVHFERDFSFQDFSETLRRLICDNNLRQAMEVNANTIKLGVSFEDFCNTYRD
jgi:UDP-N-acetylglucosamine--N-acetylmuramyl-(pentapeptide) pyrophosphoryl-undecaprenol N-acetylglucosamine transferase